MIYDFIRNDDALLAEEPIFSQELSTIFIEVAHEVLVEQRVIAVDEFGFPYSYTI